MAGKGGGAWKVAYADFVTAMMAFFMVMWIVAQGKPVREAVAGYFKDPTKAKAAAMSSSGSPIMPAAKPTDAGGPSPIPSSKSGNATGIERNRTGTRGTGRKPAFAEGKSPDGDPKKARAPERPNLLAIHGGDDRNIGALVVFAEDSTELDDVNKDRLKRILPDMLGKRHKIEVRGHASRRPLPPGSKAKDAWELSYARCRATMNFLMDQGIEQERIRLSQGGPFEPYTLRVDSALQSRNSRVEVYMLAELAEDLIGTPDERAKHFSGP
jgi:chemotaxis protein MotB